MQPTRTLRSVLAVTVTALALSCQTPAPNAAAAPAAGTDCRRVLTPPAYPNNPTDSPAKTFGDGYEFTEDWFTRNVPVWREHLGALRDQADLRYLEVGTFEGMSALWILRNVATAPSATVEGVDPYFDQATQARMQRNLERSGNAGRFKLHRGLSADVLPRLTPASYHLIYIDGSHTADDVLADAVLCWLLLQPGGLLIFDDWQFASNLPEELRPTVAVDAFITAYRRRLELVHRGYQVIIRKLPPTSCGSHPFCTPIGTSSYDFSQQRLLDATGQPVELSAGERTLLERLLTEQRFGAAGGEFEAVDIDRLGRPAVAALATKLGLKLP
jgi:predicted O-methyltransferase YrrM